MNNTVRQGTFLRALTPSLIGEITGKGLYNVIIVGG